jgi:hypothetical protein
LFCLDFLQYRLSQALILPVKIFVRKLKYVQCWIQSLFLTIQVVMI